MYFDCTVSEDSEEETSKVLKRALKVTYIKNRRYIRMPNFTASQVKLLKRWFEDHLDNPYPTYAEKSLLSKESGLTKKQIKNWFTNSRKVKIYILKPMQRIWVPLIKKKAKGKSLDG